MKKIGLALVGILCVIQSALGQASWQWTRSLQQVAVASVAADGSGGMYVVGSFSSPVSFTSPNFNGVLTLAPVGASDVFLARLDANGNLSWARQVGGSGASASGAGITPDGQGGLYVVGRFTGTLTANTGTGSLAGSLGYSSVLVMRCSASTGSAYWSRRVGTNESASGALAVAVGPGAVGYVTGFVSGNVTFGSYAVFGGRAAAFVAAYSAAGAVNWVTAGAIDPLNGGISSASGSWASKVAVDGAGNCYVTGRFTTGLKLGGLQLADNGLFNPHSFVARLNPGTGTAVWLKGTTGTVSADRADGTGLALYDGFCYVGGTFGGTVSFGGIYTLTTGNPTTGYLGRLDAATGTTAWVRPLGAAATNVHVAAGAANVLATVGIDAVSDYSRLVSYAPSGVYQWALTATGPGSSKATDVAQYGPGVAFWTGSWQGTCSFGPTTLTAPAGTSYGYVSRIHFTSPAARTAPDQLSSAPELYPNPGSGQIQLHTASAAPRTMRVYSSSGQLMLQQQVQAADVTLDVRNWPQGTYWVHLQGRGAPERQQIWVR
ncbi:T9SS type A sorting domain-containing protein [Hymenobacter chitinivorans]|uniref:Putative secreted protein (Por secretion system target) n=1 Tax=Hymenobacter chitinivorans DSM 11115 TaxID=1121954 RepID=A0A2M9BRC3_9BACT|nr:T9SS type A sorting domain-containing protein [Hymenobacter chitinivorans]PJJ60490.1 putative secreted protein (Por secretion system target) [Hymenobacter chitinivorans DSM 11115]